MLTDPARVLLNHVPPQVERLWAARLIWRETMHRGQVHPKGAWRGWMLQSGRGYGKTTIGAIDCAEHCLDYPGYRYGIIAPTLGDARETALEGETGLIQTLTDGNSQMPGLGLVEGRDFAYNRSRMEVEFANGSHVKGFGSEKPDRLRGPNHHRLWFEELASFRDAYKGDELQTTFNNATLGLRLRGKGPTQYIVTTTPRPVKLITELADRKNVVVTRGTTYDNLKNLDPEFAAEILKYEGTHLGRQELLGEIITEVPGALWKFAWINPYRLDEVPDMTRLVVGVDPSGGAGEIGIVAAGKIKAPCPCGHQDHRGPHFAVVADATMTGSPEAWARRVTDTYHDWKADRVIAERNYGGDMVESTIRVSDRTVPVKVITASRGKAQRAEPVSTAYEQGRVHHVGGLPELETQLISWVPGDDWSPDRLDALVWAITDLDPGVSGKARASNVTQRVPTRVG